MKRQRYQAKHRLRMGANRTYDPRLWNVKRDPQGKHGLKAPLGLNRMDGSTDAATAREWHTTVERRRTNEALMNDLNSEDGQASSLLGELRVKDAYIQRRRQRASRRRRYGGRCHPDRRLRASVKNYVAGIDAKKGEGEESRPSMLAPMEQRLDVMLWRSGLVVSMAMAHQQCRHGHVQVTFPGDRPAILRSSGIRRVPGTKVQRLPTVWSRRLPMVEAHWNAPDQHRQVPAYLAVDWSTGSAVLTRLPRDGEVLAPMYAMISLAS